MFQTDSIRLDGWNQLLAKKLILNEYQWKRSKQ